MAGERAVKGERGGLVIPLCSQNAHDETVLVRCAQLEIQPGRPLRGRKIDWENPCGPLLPEQRRGWSLMIFCARATRGLGRPSLDARSWGFNQTTSQEGKRWIDRLGKRVWPTAPGARTIRMCSLDGRSGTTTDVLP